MFAKFVQIEKYSDQRGARAVCTYCGSQQESGDDGPLYDSGAVPLDGHALMCLLCQGRATVDSSIVFLPDIASGTPARRTQLPRMALLFNKFCGHDASGRCPSYMACTIEHAHAAQADTLTSRAAHLLAFY